MYYNSQNTLKQGHQFKFVKKRTLVRCKDAYSYIKGRVATQIGCTYVSTVMAKLIGF